MLIRDGHLRSRLEESVPNFPAAKGFARGIETAVFPPQEHEKHVPLFAPTLTRAPRVQRFNCILVIITV